MFFRALQEPGGVQLGDDSLAGLESVEAAETFRHVIVQGRARSQDVDLREVVPHTDFVVIEIMRGRDLHEPGAERRVDVRVADDRNQALRQRQPDCFADEVFEAIVIGVHGHRGVAEKCFRPRGRHYDETRLVLERIADVPQKAVLLIGFHLEIGQGGEQYRVPVDQSLAAVDQPFLVQADEHLNHRARQTRVHRESVTTPVDGIAEAAHLSGDGAAGLLLPLPHPFEEFFPSEFGALQALGIELAFDHHLGGNAGMVRSRLPQRAVAEHPVIASERIHQRVLECVPHVQRPRNVRGWDNDAIGCTVSAGCKPAL